MKTLTLLMSLFPAFAHAENYSCRQELDTASAYFLRINVSSSEAVILQSSRVGRFAPIRFSLRPSKFFGTIKDPEFFCEEKRGQYSVRILVKSGIVQVFQEAPNARFSPLEFREVK